MANYHPSEELLTLYSAGNLPLSLALCISAHLEHCEECRETQKRLNELGSQIFQDLEPAPASSNLFDRVLSNLSSGNRKLPEQTAKPKNSALPNCLRQFIPGEMDNISWQRLTPSIYRHKLCTDGCGAQVELLKMKAGGSTSTHTHAAEEYTVILKGSFSDEEGLYMPGDFLVRDASHQHKPVATKDQDCICLSVTFGPIQFTGFFTRLLNPLLKRSFAASV